MTKILVIPDTQAKPNVDLSYMEWIGKYIADKRPDIVVHLGDNWDMESLSSYDKGKLSFEGRRFKKDLEVGQEAITKLMKPIKELQQKQKYFKKKVYNPRLVFCLGNHEQRILRVPSEMPEFDGFINYDLLGLESNGWEVHDFLKPVEICGIYFVHFLANPFTGKPYGGTALNQLKTVGKSYVAGHKQTLDVAIRPTLDSKMQLGIICGACYEHQEPYKGHQGNCHFRGLVMLNDAHDGYGDPMFVSLKYLKNKYSS